MYNGLPLLYISTVTNKQMIRTKELISALIHTYEGWAVREQFECTFYGEEGDFEDQNNNALRLIEKHCTRLANSGVLSEEAQNDLDSYLERLQEYLLKNS